MGGVPRTILRAVTSVPRAAASAASEVADVVSDTARAVTQTPRPRAAPAPAAPATPSQAAEATTEAPAAATPSKPAAKVTRSTEDQRRAAASVRARRIGSRGLLSRRRASTLGLREDQKTTLGAG